MNQHDRSRIYDALLGGSRGPFIDILTQWLELAPSAEAIERLAEAKPGEYIRAVRSLAPLAGFHDRLEVDQTITHVHQLGDSQLAERLQQVRERLKAANVPPDNVSTNIGEAEAKKESEAREPKPPSPLLLTYQPD